MGAGASEQVFQPLEEDDPAAVGNYRLTSRLGSGGMGKVYLSYTPGGRPVAVKVIRPELAEDADFRRRFRQEVLAAQRVQGLYTAPVVDSDAESARPWLATAYVPGPTLSSAVAEHGPLPVPTLLLLVAGIAEALQAVHAAGLVHRDLKPSNVILASDGPRVIDFGIARAADATALTDSGVTVGTPAFMSPEQAAGREIGPATDVFALGQVAAYAALGSPAYGEGPSHAVLYRIVHEEPDLSALPADLVPLVTACLAKDPAARPSLADIVGMCQAASAETQLRRPEQWLPGAVAAEIPQRHAAPTYVPPAVPYTPTAPVAHQAGPPPVPAPGTPPPGHDPRSYQQTQAAGPVAGHPQGTPPPMPVPQNRGYGPGPGPRPGGPGPYGPMPPRPFVPQPPKKSRNKVLVVVGAVVGALFVISAAASVIRALGGSGDSTDTNSANGGSHSTGSGSTSGSSGGTSHQSAKTPDPKPTTHPNVQLPDGYHLEFADETLQPKDSNFDDLYYGCDFEGCNFGAYNTKLVLLNADEKGSLATCLHDTRFTNVIQQPRLSAGSQICARTQTGIVALVTYKKASGSSDPSKNVVLDVTVWRNAIPASTD
ncbi:serine/threonine-protein kinase [Streptomyces sp. NPDC051976]|uniref:serine/threonine-protein kinase n=1 Tax=Streptomyces sp. NPDC051976 TaxID=3154947 RepID=UPI0034372036